MRQLRRLPRALAVGTYLLLTRLLLALLVLVPGVYFLVNASPFPDHLTRLLQGVLPGRLEFGRIQVAPIPWQVDVQDVHIRAPDGEAVISARTVRTRLNLIPLLRFLSGTSRELHLHFRHVYLEDYEALVDFDDQGHLHLVDAFSRPSERRKDSPGTSSSEPGTPVRLTFDRITGQRGACRVSFPEWDIRVEGVALETRLSVVTAPETRVRVEASRVTFTGGLGQIRAAPSVTVIPRYVPMGPGEVQGFLFDWDRISFDRASFALPGLALEAEAGMLAWEENLRHEGIAELRFDPDSPLLTLGTRGILRGPLRLQVRGRGDADDARVSLALDSPDLWVGPLSLGSVGLQFEGGKDELGHYLLSGIEATASGPLGHLRITGGSMAPFGAANGRAAEASLAASFSGLDPAAWMRVLGQPVPTRPVPFPEALSGRLLARWEVANWTGLDGTLSVAGEVLATLPPRSILADDQARCSLDLTASGPLARAVLEVREAGLRAGTDHLRLQGRIRLGDGRLDLSGNATKDLGSLLAVMGQEGSGRIALTTLRITGTATSPHLTADARLEDLDLGAWKIPRAEARLSWDRSRLLARSIQADLAMGALRITEAEWRQVPRGGSRLVVREASAPALDPTHLSFLRPLDLRGRTALQVPLLEMDFLGSGIRLSAGSARLSAASWSVAKRSLRDVRMDWLFSDGTVLLNHFSARTPEGGTLEGQGSLSPGSMTLHASLQAREIPLPWITGLGEETLGGTLEADLRTDGMLSDPRFEARLAVEALRVLRQPFPGLEITASRDPSQDLQIKAERFLPRVRVLPETRITWRDGGFRQVVMALRLDHVSPQDLWPPIRPELVSGMVQSDLVLRYGLDPGGALEGEWLAPPDGVHLRWANGEAEVVNTTPWRVRLTPEGSLELDSVTLRDGSLALHLCGVALGTDGNMNLRVGGDLSIHWLRVFLKEVAVAEGFLHLGAANLSEPPPELLACPTDPSGESLRLLGSWKRPLAEGVVTVGDLEIALRGMGESIRVSQGGLVLLGRRNRRLSLVVPKDAPIRGTWGEGRLMVFGEALLDGLTPDQGHLVVEGAGIPISRPGEFRLVLNPTLEARFESSKGEQSRLRIRGRLQVPEGSYHQNLDIISRAFSQMTGTRQVQREGRSVQEMLPWLAEADLDVAVTGGPLEVRMRLPIGETDLDVSPDLRIRGRLASPEVWNRLVVIPGGKVIYNVFRREFEVVRGVLDFDGDPGRPKVDLLARTLVDLPGVSDDVASFSSRFGADTDRSTGFDEGLLVTLQLSGRFPDLDIALSSSSRNLSQADLQSLILTGTFPQGGNQVSSGGGQVISLGLLTQDVTEIATRLLLGSLLDSINLGVSPEGKVNLDLMAHLGSRLRFETQVMQGAMSSRYQAGFQVALSDLFSLIGRVRSIERDPDPSRVGNRYETKLRLRIPLE